VCCLGKQERSSAERARRMREIQGWLEQRLLRFARGRMSRSDFAAAWKEFAQGRKDLEADGPESQLFEPWFLYDWRPRAPRRPAGRGSAPDPSAVGPVRPVARHGAGPGSTLAKSFVDAEGAGMRDSERAFIETVSSAPHSFYDVISRDPGRAIRLRDILRGVDYEVTERSASRSVGVGDILFARVAPFDGFALLVGTGSIPLPPVEKMSILELRRSPEWARTADHAAARA